MSLIIFDSFDFGNEFQSGDKWTSLNSGAILPTSIGGLTCWRVTNRSSNVIVKDFPAAQTVIIGFRFFSGYGSDPDNEVVAFRNQAEGTTHLTCEITGADGAIRFLLGGTSLVASTTFGAYPSNEWCYVEIKVTIDDSAGVIEMRVDNEEVLNATGLDTRNGGTTATVDRVGWGAQRGVNHYYRDMVIMDSAGSAPFNDFLGPIRVRSYLPTSDGTHTDWTPLVGSTHYVELDEQVPDGDTSYLESTSTGVLRDSFNYDDLPTEMEGIAAVQVAAVARYDGTPMALATFLSRSTSISDGDSTLVPNTYQTHSYQVWETDPITAGAWSSTLFNDTEFGIKSTTST